MGRALRTIVGWAFFAAGAASASITTITVEGSGDSDAFDALYVNGSEVAGPGPAIFGLPGSLAGKRVRIVLTVDDAGSAPSANDTRIENVSGVTAALTVDDVTVWMGQWHGTTFSAFSGCGNWVEFRGADDQAGGRKVDVLEVAANGLVPTPVPAAMAWNAPCVIAPPPNGYRAYFAVMRPVDVAADRYAFARGGVAVTRIAVEFRGPAPRVSAERIAQVVEYYNAALDHYFVTWAPDEIAKLDAGTVIKGWTRTGQAFKAMKTTQAGASPVCRYYIPPALGDSHFFGRGVAECAATARNGPALILESPDFMQVFLPLGGACPANSSELYRVFSNRQDANHRYTASRAVRDEMVAKGWLAEGDGPDRVVMCAPQ